MIQRHLATMDHVELLMILRGSREGSFTLPQLAEKMGKPLPRVDQCLESLTRAGLAAQLSDGTYRYAAREETLDRTAESLVRL